MLVGLCACSGGGDKTIVLHSEADLTGLTVACSKGNYYHQHFQKREDISLFVANTDPDAVQALTQGLADVFVSDELMLTPETMNRLGIKKAMSGEESFDVSFALRKGDAGLMQQLNSFIASAPIDRIIAHWLDDGPDVPFDSVPVSPDAPPLRCITAVNMEPVCYAGEDGEFEGMDPDILRRFAASVGRPLEVTFQDLGSAVIALQTGKADIVSACLFVTEERKKSVDFSDPYYYCRPGYFVMDKSPKTRIGLKERFKINLVNDNRWKLIADGLQGTVIITILSILLGTVLGVGICACKRSKRKWLRLAASVYSSLLSGIPTLVLLLTMFYVVFAETGLDGILIAVFTFALYFASSSGSIFDSSISSVPAGQMEAGLSLGFTPFKTFTGIVLPQAVKKGLPLYTGECVSLLKSTSIVGYIAVQDLTRASDLIRSRTFDALIPLLVVTVLYFVLAWLLRVILKLLLLKKK